MLWNEFKKQKPTAYETGCWDGKRSDIVLVQTIGKNLFLCRMYHTVMDGKEQFDFCDNTDFIIDNVKYWASIDSMEPIKKEVPKINQHQFTEVVDAPPSELSILRTKLWADTFICDMPNQHGIDWKIECGNIADEAVAEFDKRFKI